MNNIFQFLPNLFNGLLYLFFGWILAGFIKAIVQKINYVFDLQRFVSHKSSRTNTLIRRWPFVAGEVVFWLILFSFLIPALHAWRVFKDLEILHQVHAVVIFLIITYLLILIILARWIIPGTLIGKRKSLNS